METTLTLTRPEAPRSTAAPHSAAAAAIIAAATHLGTGGVNFDPTATQKDRVHNTSER